MELEKGVYRHSKSGGTVLVLGMAKHSETEELMVNYLTLQTKKLCVRPKEVFLKNIVKDGQEVPAFVKVSKQEELEEIKKANEELAFEAFCK